MGSLEDRDHATGKQASGQNHERRVFITDVAKNLCRACRQDEDTHPIASGGIFTSNSPLPSDAR